MYGLYLGVPETGGDPISGKNRGKWVSKPQNLSIFPNKAKGTFSTRSLSSPSSWLQDFAENERNLVLKRHEIPKLLAQEHKLS